MTKELRYKIYVDLNITFLYVYESKSFFTTKSKKSKHFHRCKQLMEKTNNKCFIIHLAH